MRDRLAISNVLDRRHATRRVMEEGGRGPRQAQRARNDVDRDGCRARFFVKTAGHSEGKESPRRYSVDNGSRNRETNARDC